MVIDFNDFSKRPSIDWVYYLIAVGYVIASLIFIEFTTLQSKVLLGLFSSAGSNLILSLELGKVIELI